MTKPYIVFEQLG